MKLILLLFVLLLIQSICFSQSTIVLNPNTSQAQSIELVRSDKDTTILRFNVNYFRLEEVDYQCSIKNKVVLDNAPLLLEKGNPDLPKLVQSIVIPDNAEMEVSVLSSVYEDFTDIDIISSKGNLKHNDDSNLIPYTFNDCYQQNQFFPTSLAELQKPYIFRTTKGQAVTVYPFQYNPIIRTLRVYSSLTIKVSTKTKSLNKSATLSTENSSAFESMYSSHFLNYDAVQSKNKSYSTIYEDGNMLIIAPKAYLAVLQEFIAWKKMRGIDVFTEDVANLPTQTDIKNKVLSYYQNNSLTFLLLVGDNEQVPTFRKDLFNDVKNAACDAVYGQLVGDDSYPEVMVGRWSAETVAQLQTQIKRTLDYEKNPIIDNYYTKYALIASDTGPGDNNEYDHQHMRNIKRELLNYNYTGGEELYDGSQGEEDVPGDVSVTQVLSSLNQGRGLWNYIGHGSSTMLGTSGFSESDVPSLTNIGKLPFAVFVACRVGDFPAQTCLAETLVRATSNNQPTGALAVFASTILQDWNPPMAAHDEMIRILTEQYSNNTRHTFGCIAVEGCMKMVDSYAQYGANNSDTWAYFGDPSLQIRTSTPQTITATYHRSITIGTMFLDIQTDHKKLIYTLIQNGQIISYSTSMGVSLRKAVVGKCTLAITGYNCIPIIDEITILESTQINPIVTSIVVDDSKGNNNASLDCSEKVNLNLILSFGGKIPEFPIKAQLFSDDKYISIIESTADYTSDTNLTPFVIQCSDSIAHLHSIPFKIKLSNSSGIWEDSFALKALAPAPKLTFVALNQIKGNNNGYLDSNETFELVISAKNQGSNIITQSACSFMSNVFVKSNTAIITSNLGTDELIYTFIIQAIQFTPIKTYVDLDVRLNIGKYSTTLKIPEIINPQVENWETGSFSSNWINRGNAPWSITKDAYKGTYSAKSGAISANQQSILAVRIISIRDDSISFYRKVSSEKNCDLLSFRINQVEQISWSGELDWERYSIYVPAGDHTFQWYFTNDAASIGGSNAAWLDNIVFPKYATTTNKQPELSTEPITTLMSYQSYYYKIETFDLDNDKISLACLEKSDWLTFVDNGDGTGYLYGTPTSDSQAVSTVILALSDGISDINLVEYTITQTDKVRTVIEKLDNWNFSIAPNPTNATTTINYTTDSKRFTVSIYNSLGILIKNAEVENQSSYTLENLPKGIYFVKLKTQNRVGVKRLIVE